MRAPFRFPAQFRRVYDWANLLDSRSGRVVSSVSNSASLLCNFTTITDAAASFPLPRRACATGNAITSSFITSNRHLRFISTISSTAKDFEEDKVEGSISVAKGSSYLAIEVALDSVVKIFTVSSSPNYFLPWQNKPQRETMGSGILLLPYTQAS